MKLKKRILSFLLIAVLLTSMIPGAVYADEGSFDNFKASKIWNNDVFGDVASSDWFFENVKTVFKLGLMVGKSQGRFDPEGSVTVAESITIAARLRSTYTGDGHKFEATDPWYQAYVDYLSKYGVKNTGVDYNDPAPREVFAYILVSALPGSALEAKNTVDDGMIPDVPSNGKYSEYIYKLYRSGIVVGNDAAGNFAPKSNVRRCEVAAIIGRIAIPEQRRSVELKAAVKAEETKEPATSSSPSLKITSMTKITEPIYSDLGVFREGYMAVKKGSLWGYIDITGKEVVSPQYYNCTSVRNGYVLVADGFRDGTYNVKLLKDFKEVKCLTEYRYDYEHGKYVSEPLWLTEDEFDDITFGEHAMMIGSSPYTYDGEYISVKNPEVLRPAGAEYADTYKIFDMIGGEINGIIPMCAYSDAYYQIPPENARVPKVFHMDLKGNIVKTFDSNPKAYAIMDSEGNYTVPAERSIVYASAQENGFRIVEEGYRLYAKTYIQTVYTGLKLINEKGECIIGPLDALPYYWTSTGKYLADGILKVFDNNLHKFGVYNTSGKLIVPFSFDDITRSSFSRFIYAEKDGVSYIFDSTGKMYDIPIPESCGEGKIKDYGLSGDIIWLSVGKSNEHTWLIAYNKAADSFEIVDGSVDVGIVSSIYEGYAAYAGPKGKIGIMKITIG
ncbi:MAG TPA: hypothetical protein GX704_02230 [Clostridiales bacterium]|jgi:hypothetical protein|nr:hypothetical protein [Clostridiales bacterium]